MGAMRYKPLDKVRIKSLDWYNENKNKFGNVWGHYPFDKDMSKYCGKVMTISHIRGDHYTMVENLVNYWTDNMIECKVEEETKPHNNMCKQLIDEMNPNVEVNVKVKTEPETTCEGKKRCVVYFWDNDFADKVELDLSNRELIQEDGKWFVVKKKKYPKTYEECCRIVNANPCIRLVYNLSDGQKYYHDEDNLYLYENFRRLKICRDAYWKIAGEEMGLGKPWEPDYMDLEQTKFCIVVSRREVGKWETAVDNYILAFPTREMRDAFYENFKELINECKELL